MTPGENVNKDVSVVNTGNVDAFTRVALENQLTISAYGKEDITTTFSASAPKTYYLITKTTTSITSNGADNESDVVITDAATQTATQIGGKWYLQTITQENLPKLFEYSSDRDTEKAAVIAGNVNVGTSGQPGSITYTYGDGTTTVAQPYDLTVGTIDTTNGVKLSTTESTNINTGKLTPNEVTTLQAGGKLVIAASKVVAAKDQIVVTGDDTTPPSQTDYDGSGQYTPGTAGLYIFERTVYEGTGNNKTEYSGYYYDGTDFYALKTKVNKTTTGSTATPYIDFGEYDSGSGVMVSYNGFTYDADGQVNGLPSGAGISLLTKETYKTEGVPGIADTDKRAKVTFETGTLTETANAADSWTQTNTASDINAIKLIINTEESRTTADDPSTVTYSGTANGTVIYIKLDSNWYKNWDLIQPTNATPADVTPSIVDWFYYKDTVKSGETTEKLVDYVRIDNTVSQNDFVDIVYDMNVVLESMQVTHDTEGDETATAVPVGPTSGASAAAANWATPTLTTNPVDQNGDVTTITKIDWTATPTT